MRNRMILQNPEAGAQVYPDFKSYQCGKVSAFINRRGREQDRQGYNAQHGHQRVYIHLRRAVAAPGDARRYGLVQANDIVADGR